MEVNCELIDILWEPSEHYIRSFYKIKLKIKEREDLFELVYMPLPEDGWSVEWDREDESYKDTIHARNVQGAVKLMLLKMGLLEEVVPKEDDVFLQIVQKIREEKRSFERKIRDKLHEFEKEESLRSYERLNN